MLDEIIQGDNGTVMNLTIKDHKGIVDIRGATIEVVLLNGSKRTVKPSQVTNGELGQCSFTLSSTDVSESGTYYFQTTITFGDGKSFSSNVRTFKVRQKI